MGVTERVSTGTFVAVTLVDRLTGHRNRAGATQRREIIDHQSAMPLTHEDISELYREHSPLLLRYLMRRTFDAQAAVELMAETFAVAYERRASCRQPGAVAKAWGDVKLTPTTYLVDKQGQIVKRYVGEPNFAELHALIEKLLVS